jgi:hypothetical protein
MITFFLNLYHKTEESVSLQPPTLQPPKGRGAEAEAPNITIILFLFEGWRFGFLGKYHLIWSLCSAGLN